MEQRLGILQAFLGIVLAQAMNLQDGALVRLFRLQHGGADGRAPGVMLRHQERLRGEREGLAQCARDAGILRDRADERHRRFHRAALDDGAFEIARHRVAQTAQNFGRRIALLLGVDHVALGEHRAAAGDARGATGAGDHAAHFLHGVLHAQRLLVEERPGAGGAFARAVVIHDAAAIQTNVFGAFAADFEDRAHLRVDRADHAGDGFEFVLEEQPQHLGDGAAAGTGDADAFDAVLGNHFVELAQQVVGGLYGAAGDAAVIGERQGLAGEVAEAELRVGFAEGREGRPIRGFTEGGELQTDGADVQTEIDAHFRPV